MCSGEESPGGRQRATDAAAGSRGIHGSQPHAWGSPGGSSRAGPSRGLSTLLLSQPFPGPPQVQPRQGVLPLPPSLPARLHLDVSRVFSASSPANQPLCLSRDSICSVWRRLCLELGSALQSRAEFTSTLLFPNLCSGIQFDPNLWIFVLWKEL